MRGSDAAELSRREREIALAYSEGATHREIGERLFISPATVRTHLGTIYRKLGVSSKIGLLHALRTGDPSPSPAPARWTSLAVMPFRLRGAPHDEIADGLVHDVIARIARLRSVRVIARGSVFALAERGMSDEAAAELLDADYLATGSVDRNRDRDRIGISVELVDRRSARMLWADRFEVAGAGLFEARDEIGDHIVAAVASEIEVAERNRAILARPDSLGAWESLHRGFWHMYRFTEADNELAQRLFTRAVEMDPTFSRAWAALSFTHFQNAFLLRPDERARETEQAFETAGRSLEADERDPSAHWAMGRALWLRGAGDRALAELEASLALAPNFSLGHYALAFVESQSGDPRKAIGAANHAEELSPFDPLLFGVLASRAMALLRAGAIPEAAETATRAAERPNAHHHIWMIAALCLAAAGRLGEARDLAERVRVHHPGYRASDFFAAFRFAPAAQAEFQSLAARLGLV